MLMNEFKQRLEVRGLTVNMEYDNPSSSRSTFQRYIGHCNLSITRTGDKGEKEVLRLSSGDHEELGKDKAKEAAVKEVADECIRLGIMQLK